MLIILTLIGAESMNSVIKYDENGYAETLPSLIESRRDHACGYYIDNAGKEVRCGIEIRWPRGLVALKGTLKNHAGGKISHFEQLKKS